MSDPQQLREKIDRKSRTVRVTGISPGNDAPDLFDYRVADALLPLVPGELADRDARLAELLRLNQEAEAMLRAAIETRTTELAEAWRLGSASNFSSNPSDYVNPYLPQPTEGKKK